MIVKVQQLFPRNFRAPKFVPAKLFYIRVLVGYIISNVVLPLSIFCKIPLLKWIFRPFFIRLLNQTGLFNVDWYTSQYPDVPQSKIEPQLHYLLFGDREGRLPNPIFEPFYYRAQYDGLNWHQNSLLHYFHQGWLLRLSPGSYFDISFYLLQNKDVSFSLKEPLLHYFRYGGLEGRSPNPKFDGLFYLKTYKECREMNITPLEHYIFFGKSVGYFTSHSSQRRNSHSSKSVLNKGIVKHRREVFIKGLKPLKFNSPPLVDVIIPVYSGYEESLRAIASVLVSGKFSKTAFELIVINDASPDRRLNNALDKLGKNKLFTYVKNPINLGFVGTVNRGMRIHSNRDVVLLNADTQAFGNWLDRLRCTSQIRTNTASVTPLSNNATICSYPNFLEENPLPLEVQWSEIDRLASILNQGETLELPTGHGFCIYLKRKAIKEIGLFDQQAFGKGYGEENDWCIRAAKLGWINVVALNTFVFHEGSVSFGENKKKLIAQGLKVLSDRYPDYLSNVETFIKQDPLLSYRKKLDWARLERQIKTKNILMICHSRGGGAERHLREDTAKMLSMGVGVFYLRPDPLNDGHVLFESPISGIHVNLDLCLLSNTEELAFFCRRLKITSIHDHGLIDFGYYADNYVNYLVKELCVEFIKEIHDYKIICPRLNLVNSKGQYCYEAIPFECNKCINAKANIFNATNINAWRKMQHESLKLANQILVPDLDVSERILRYFPDLNIKISPHALLKPKPIKGFSLLKENFKNIEVLVIGAIGDIKGYNVLLDCAKDARKNNLPITFKLMGYSKDDVTLRAAGVEILGRYSDDEAVDLCRKYNPNIVWLPSIWPETYSYTLDIALEVGIPVMAFDIGAIARRLACLSGYPKIFIPLNKSSDPNFINKNILINFKDK
jgi:GT2 family glycosyltransferase/glycosyltransferase involved in cell wall biosynthesis